MIISNQESFARFWRAAKGKRFEEQLELWDSLVEATDRVFFEKYVHAAESQPDWREKKRKKAETAFAEYPSIYEPMIELFEGFAETFQRHLTIFGNTFSNFSLRNLELRVIANLKRFGATSEMEGERHFLSFSVDFMASIQRDPGQVPGLVFVTNPGVLYAHEIFHVYHQQNHPLAIQPGQSTHKLIERLWSEGLAVFVSGQINPDATMDELLVFEGILPSYLENKTSIHRKLLMDLKTITKENYFQLEDKWCGTYNEHEKMPPMAGYAIGNAFVSELTKTNPLSSLLRWPIERVENEFLRFLSS